MSDYFLKLVNRALDLVPKAQPLITSRFAQSSEPAAGQGFAEEVQETEPERAPPSARRGSLPLHFEDAKAVQPEPALPPVATGSAFVEKPRREDPFGAAPEPAPVLAPAAPVQADDAPTAVLNKAQREETAAAAAAAGSPRERRPWQARTADADQRKRVLDDPLTPPAAAAEPPATHPIPAPESSPSATITPTRRPPKGAAAPRSAFTEAAPRPTETAGEFRLGLAKDAEPIPTESFSVPLPSAELPSGKLPPAVENPQGAPVAALSPAARVPLRKQISGRFYSGDEAQPSPADSANAKESPGKNEQPAWLSEEAAPSIRVHIGRVEIRELRAPAPPASPASMTAPAPPKAAPGLSLTDYLRRQRGR